MAKLVDLDLSQPERKLRDLARALRAAEEGKTLRRELVKGLRSAAQPARQDARSAIMSMPSTTKRKGPGLRAAIAKKITVAARSSGRAVGVKIVAKKTPNLRGFTNAPRRTNSPKGWRHPVYGHRTRWTAQIGKPGWFDDAIKKRKNEYREAVVDAMDKVADKVAGKV